MDDVQKVLGFEPSAELRRTILKTAKEKSIPVLEAASAYQLPEMMILDQDGRALVDGKRMTPQEVKAENPFRQLIIIR